MQIPFALALVAGASLPAFVAAAPPFVEVEDGTTSAETEETHLLDRVVLIGASLTGGFGMDVAFDEVFEATIARDHGPLAAKSNLLFYLGPGPEGGAQAAFAAEANPTLLVAIDFLFWFGYGMTNAEGEFLGTEEQRLQLLEHGLGLLERFDCPIVVGDFPDMSDAVATKMLHPRQMPQHETLARLNARLRAWAEERGDVFVLPLSERIRDMRAGDPFRIGRGAWPADSGHRVLQDDQLHPTIEGMAALANEIALMLSGAELTEEEDWELDLALVLDEFGEVWVPIDEATQPEPAGER